MSGGDVNRFFTMAEIYDRMCRLMVPHYDLLQDEVLAMVDPTPPSFVVDLAAGSGIFLERVLERYPEAACLWVDYSEDFLAVARRRLQRFAGRVEFLQSRIEESWEDRLDRTPDLILSMSAIHHLSDPEKRRLYQRCFALLSSGGRLFNIDEMQTLYPEATLASFRRWVDYTETRYETLGPESRDDIGRWRAVFSRWIVRNVDGYGQPREEGDDLHLSFDQQVRWLKEIGFLEPDLYIKYHLWCVVGGIKP